MSGELFRFAVIRPAEATNPSPTIRLNSSISETKPTYPVDDKTIETWVTQFSNLVRSVRQHGINTDVRVVLGSFSDVDLKVARDILHHRLLSAPAGEDHLELADAVRGISMVQMGTGTDTAILKAMTAATLVLGHETLRRRRSSSKKPNVDTMKAFDGTISELLILAEDDPLKKLRSIIGQATKDTVTVLSKVGLSEPNEQTVAQAIATIGSIKADSNSAEWIATASGIRLAQGLMSREWMSSSGSLPKPEPSGIAELKVVRQQVVRYEAGEVAHIENVLARESRERVHRTLDRSEEMFMFDTETTRDESRDLQTTERFELSSESRQQIENSNEWAVGASVSASYGPTLEVGLETSAAGASQRSKATQRASSFAREVTENAASAVTTRIREKRERSMLTEVEQTNRHAINNAESDQNVVGVYQWVDKIMQVQVFSYESLRLMYDLIIPEPGAFLTYAMTEEAQLDHSSVKPPPKWELEKSMLKDSNWVEWAIKYGAIDITSYPEAVTKFVQIEIKPDTEGAPFIHTEELTLPDGYIPLHARIGADIVAVTEDIISDRTFYRIGSLKLYALTEEELSGEKKLINSARLVVSVYGFNKIFDKDMISQILLQDNSTFLTKDFELPQYDHLYDQTHGNVPVSIVANAIDAGTVTVKVVCFPSIARVGQWQYEVYNQIRQAYEVQMSAYQAQLEQMDISSGIDIEGRSPTENRRLERNELKKQAITAFTRKHFDFDAVEEGSEDSYPRLDLTRYKDQGAVIRFFEQAFEWSQMTWVVYPYYWARTEKWVDLLATTGADPQHIEFLRSGAARLQIPVRLGFEASVLHYQSTDEIWLGANAPQIHDEAYLSIVQELAEQLGKPGTEKPDSDPWEIRLPTDLIKLNPDGTLPKWYQDENGDWHPVEAAK